MNGTFQAGDQLIWTAGFGRGDDDGQRDGQCIDCRRGRVRDRLRWITHLQNRGQRRSRAGAGGDSSSGGNGASGSNDGFSLGSWFSSDSSGSSADGGSCSSSDSGGGDCGGGGGGGGD